MKKIFAILILILQCSLVYAQGNYIKILKDTSINEKKFFKGEIYLSEKKSDDGKSYEFKAFAITIHIDAKSVKEIKDDIAPVPSSDTLALINEAGLVHIDVTALKNEGDTIKVIAESGQQTPLATRATVDLSKESLGAQFRIIIPGKPTVFYTTNELVKKSAPEKSETSDDNPNDNDTKKKPASASWWQWYYLLFAIPVLAVIGYFLFRKYSKGKIPVKIKYTNSDKSLGDFAVRNGLTLKKLIKLNYPLIPGNYNDLTEQDKKAYKRKIQEEGSLIIGYTRKHAEETQPDSDLYTDNQLSPGPADASKTNIGSQLSQMERNIIKEIRALNDTDGNAISKLENELKNLKSDFKKQGENISQLEFDKNKLQTQKDALDIQVKQKTSTLEDLQGRVVTADFLKTYSSSVLSYLALCNQVLSDANTYFNNVSKQDVDQAKMAGLLLSQYQNGISQLPVGNWTEILQGIKDSGTINSKRVKDSLKQHVSEEDKIKQFQRQLFSEVLVKYSSEVLILAEAFSNFLHFHSLPAAAFKQIQGIFEKHITSLVPAARSIGIEVRYVQLFQNFNAYAALVTSVEKEKSLPYRNIENLEKGTIAEIVFYGVKTPFEDTKTNIILA